MLFYRYLDLNPTNQESENEPPENICGEPFHHDEILIKFSFICSGVLVLIVGTFGLMCNALTCLTLKMMSKSMTLFNKLLLTLAIIDSFFILSGGALMTKHSFE